MSGSTGLLKRSLKYFFSSCRNLSLRKAFLSDNERCTSESSVYSLSETSSSSNDSLKVKETAIIKKVERLHQHRRMRSATHLFWLFLRCFALPPVPFWPSWRLEPPLAAEVGRRLLLWGEPPPADKEPVRLIDERASSSRSWMLVVGRRALRNFYTSKQKRVRLCSEKNYCGTELLKLGHLLSN